MVSDHCAAFRNAFYKHFPEGVFGQCYPHIKRKYGEGEYTSEKWLHFDEAGEDIKGIHLAGTPEMKTLITRVVGVSRVLPPHTFERRDGMHHSCRSGVEVEYEN